MALKETGISNCWIRSWKLLPPAIAAVGQAFWALRPGAPCASCLGYAGMLVYFDCTNEHLNRMDNNPFHISHRLFARSPIFAGLDHTSTLTGTANHHTQIRLHSIMPFLGSGRKSLCMFGCGEDRAKISPSGTRSRHPGFQHMFAYVHSCQVVRSCYLCITLPTAILAVCSLLSQPVRSSILRRVDDVHSDTATLAYSALVFPPTSAPLVSTALADAADYLLFLE